MHMKSNFGGEKEVGNKNRRRKAIKIGKTLECIYLLKMAQK